MRYDFQNKTILITGATGLLGKNITARLLGAGGKVRAFVRNPEKAATLARQGVEIVVGDMADPIAIRSAVQGCQAIFHFAGLLAEFLPYQAYHRINVEGTRTLAEAALEAGVERFIHTSSVAVYGLDTPGPVNEESPRVITRHFYANTKREGENAILELATSRGLPAVIVQPAEVYGPEDESWTLEPVKLLRSGMMLHVDGGKGLLQPIYLEDIIDGIVLAGQQGRIGQAYILAGEQVVTVAEFFGYYQRMLDKPNIPSLPAWAAQMAVATLEATGKILHRTPPLTRAKLSFVTQKLSFDTGKSFRELGFLPQFCLQEGMRRVEDWLRQQGYLA